MFYDLTSNTTQACWNSPSQHNTKTLHLNTLQKAETVQSTFFGPQCKKLANMANENQYKMKLKLGTFKEYKTNENSQEC